MLVVDGTGRFDFEGMEDCLLALESLSFSFSAIVVVVVVVGLSLATLLGAGIPDVDGVGSFELATNKNNR